MSLVNSLIIRMGDSDNLSGYLSVVIYCIIDRPPLQNLNQQSEGSSNSFSLQNLLNSLPSPEEVKKAHQISMDYLRPIMVALFNGVAKAQGSLPTLLDFYGQGILESLLRALKSTLGTFISATDQSPAADSYLLLAYTQLAVGSHQSHQFTAACMDIALSSRLAKRCKLSQAGLVLAGCAAIVNDPRATIEWLNCRHLVSEFKEYWLGRSSFDTGIFYRRSSLLALSSLLSISQSIDRYEFMTLTDILSNIDRLVKSMQSIDSRPIDDVIYRDIDDDYENDNIERWDCGNAGQSVKVQRYCHEVAGMFSILDDCLIRDPFEDIDFKKIIRESLESRLFSK